MSKAKACRTLPEGFSSHIWDNLNIEKSDISYGLEHNKKIPVSINDDSKKKKGEEKLSFTELALINVELFLINDKIRKSPIFTL